MPSNELTITHILFEENYILFFISDSRKVGIPYSWLPELKNATENQRSQWEFIGQGEGVSWRELDVDISVESLFYLKPLIHSQQ